MRRLVWCSAISAVLLSLSLAGIVGPTSPAFASCGPPETVQQALASSDTDLVFIGIVVGLTNERRWATFTIDELWKGTVDSRQVEVRAGPEDPAGPNRVYSSVEGHYEAGGRYLVFARDPKAHGSRPLWGSDSRFEDNGCSATRPYVAGLGRFRPVTTQPLPAAAPPKADGAPWALILSLLGVLVAGLAGVAVVRRRSRASRPPA